MLEFSPAMSLTHIEHFLVATDDIDRTAEWYCRVLGMKEGPHPDFGFPVKWLYLGGVDVVHVGPSARQAGENQKRYLGRTSQDSGKGTGALRKAVRSLLSGHPLVESFRDGEPSEGGAGATVAALRVG